MDEKALKATLGVSRTRDNDTMAIVSLTVDEETKTRIEKFKHLNWNEMLRAYVVEVVDKEEKRLAAKKSSFSEEDLAKIEDDRSKKFMLLDLNRGTLRR